MNTQEMALQLFLKLWVWILPAVACATETVVFHTDFTRPLDPKVWRGTAGQLERVEGHGRCLMIQKPEASGTLARTIALPAKRFDGQLVTIQAQIKAENISAPTNHECGIVVR